MDRSHFWQPKPLLNLVREDSVWGGEGFQIISFEENEEAPRRNVLPEKDGFTDVVTGARHIDGASVYTAVIEKYIDERVGNGPIAEQRRILRSIENSASFVMQNLLDEMRAEHKTASGVGRDYIGNALDYLSFMRSNPSTNKIHPFDVFMRAVRIKSHEIQESEWFDQRILGEGEVMWEDDASFAA